jgi:hypothetical protein
MVHGATVSSAARLANARRATLNRLENRRMARSNCKARARPSRAIDEYRGPHPRLGGDTVRRLWRDYGLSITLATLFFMSWVLQTWFGWIQFAAEQASHGEQAEAFGDSGYIWSWGQATFENWQSEFLQVFVFIVLTTFLVHRKSHESPDTDYDTEAALRRIEAKVDALEQPRGKA